MDFGLADVSFGLIDIIGQFVLDYFASRNELTHVEDPFPILEEAANPNQVEGGPVLPSLVPVKVPIRDLRVFNDDTEMVVEANVG